MAIHAIDARLSVTLDANDVSSGEWSLLRASHDMGAAAPSALAEACGLSRGGVTRLVDRLRAKRLVVRAAAGRDDRRYQTIALTGAGALMVVKLLACERAAEDAVLAGLSAQERQRLTAMLAVIGATPLQPMTEAAPR